MLFKWFDAKEAALIGVKMADDLSQALAKTNNKHAKKEMVGRAKIIKTTFSQMDNYKRNAKLNFYKKSKLINEFRWRLSENGHDKEFVEVVTKELVLYIN